VSGLHDCGPFCQVLLQRRAGPERVLPQWQLMSHEPPLFNVPQMPMFELGDATIEHDGGSQNIVNSGQTWQRPKKY